MDSSCNGPTSSLSPSGKNPSADLCPDESRLTSKARINSFFWHDFHSRCDGAGLRQTSIVPAASAWLTDGSSLMSGSEFIDAVHVQYNCLFSRAHATWGRDDNRLCSRGCRVPETLNHIVQQCFSNHGLRIKRHNAICKHIARSHEQKGYLVNEEPIFRMTDGRKLKPDIVAYNNDHSMIIDSQIINNQFPLTEAHRAKVEKYNVLIPQLQPLRPSGTLVTSFTMNWLGAIAVES